MKTRNLFSVFFTLTLIFAFSTNSWAQESPANGTSYTQAEAEPYLLDNWENRSRLQYFSIDAATNTNIQTVFKNGGTDVTHVRISSGIIAKTNYLFTIGVSSEGALLGDYYISSIPEGLVSGPCPKHCDVD